jgi:hypothetical protein
MVKKPFIYLFRRFKMTSRQQKRQNKIKKSQKPIAQNSNQTIKNEKPDNQKINDLTRLSGIMKGIIVCELHRPKGRCF